MKLFAFTLFVLVSSLAPTLTGQAQAQTGFSLDGASFTISLPPGFVAIPTLELYAFEHPGQSGPIKPEELAQFRKTRLGFQVPAERWFTLPYLVITLESGKKRGPQDLFMDHVMAEKDAAAHSSGEGYRFMGKEHTPTKRMHYYKDMAFSSAQGRKVAMGVYTYLTNRGFLRVAWFVGEDQLKDWEQILHQTGMSVKLSPELEYKPESEQ